MFPRFLFLLSFCIAACMATVQGQVIPAADTVYYDAGWKPTTAGPHVYYRTFLSKKPDSIVIIDWYRNGVPQNRGRFRQLEPDIRVGEFVYYAPDGSVKAREWYSPAGVMTDSTVAYYPSGQIENIKEVKDGKQTGTYRSFHKGTGLPYAVGRLEGGKANGLMVFYHPDGMHLLSEIPYENDERHGVAKIYDSVGHYLRNQLSYDRGKLQGRNYRYYPDGHLESETVYANGKKEGVALFYHPNGKLQYREQYTNGQRSGLWKTFYANGAKEYELSYSEDLQDGYSVAYDSATGYKRMEGNYRGGKREGKATFRENLQTDRLVIEQNYKDGLLHGSFRQAYENSGATIMEGEMYLDKNEGLWRYYYRDGTTLQSTKEWKGGVLHGNLVTYFPNGKIRRVERYNTGQKISASCYTATEEDTVCSPRYHHADTAAFVPLLRAAILKEQPGLAGKTVWLTLRCAPDGVVYYVKEQPRPDTLLEQRSTLAITKLKAPDTDTEDGERLFSTVRVKVRL